MTVVLVAAVCIALLLLVPDYTHERRIALRHVLAARRPDNLIPRRRSWFDGYERY